MRSWDDNNDYQIAYEDTGEPYTPPAQSDDQYTQPYLQPSYEDQPQSYDQPGEIFQPYHDAQPTAIAPIESSPVSSYSEEEALRQAYYQVIDPQPEPAQQQLEMSFAYQEPVYHQEVPPAPQVIAADPVFEAPAPAPAAAKAEAPQWEPLEQYRNQFPNYSTNSPQDIEFRRSHPYGEFMAPPDNSDNFMNNLGPKNPHANSSFGSVSLTSDPSYQAGWSNLGDSGGWGGGGGWGDSRDFGSSVSGTGSYDQAVGSQNASETPAPAEVPQSIAPAEIPQTPVAEPEPYNDYRGQMDGGNGGWAGAAGGGFFDGMNSSGGEGWFGAGSDYMNNSNDFSAGGDFNAGQYMDSGNEGQGPIGDVPVQQYVAPPQSIVAPAIDTYIALQEDIYAELTKVYSDFQSAVDTHGEASPQANEAASQFEQLNNQYTNTTNARNEAEAQVAFGPSQDNGISNAINQALNPHLVNVMGTDEMGGITNFDGSYTIDGLDYTSREAAFPSAADNTPRTDMQTITTTAYRGLGNSDGDVKIILDKQFSDPAIQQVNVNGTIYNRPSDGSTNWIPEALQPGVDRLVDAVSQLPGGNLAINTVKAIPGIANALDNGIGNVLGYMENNNGVDAINDVLNAITPSGNSNMAPLGDAMGSGAYEMSNVIPDANPRPSNYVSDIKNAAGFIFDAGVKTVDGLIVHPLVEGGNAVYNLSTEVLTPEQAAKEFGRVAIGALTAAPFVGGAIKAVGAGAEFVGGVKAAVGVSEALTLDAAAARAGSNLGRLDDFGGGSPHQIPGSTLDGIVMPDGSFMPGSYIREAPGGGVPRLPNMTGAPHVEIPGGGVPRLELVPEGQVPRLEYVPDVELPRPVPTPSSPLALADDVMPDVPAVPSAAVVRETAVPFEMPQVGNSASNQALESVQRSIDNAPDLAQRFDGVLNNLRENGVEVTGLTSREMRDLTGSGQTAAVFYMDDGVPRIAMLNSLSPGAKYEALLHEVSHRTDYLNPLKNNGTGAVEFSSDAGGLLVPNYREFASVSEFKSHAVEFAAQKQVASAYIAEGNLVDAGAVTNRMRETVDARLGVQAELKDSVPKVEMALAENRPISVVEGEAGSQRYVVTIADQNGLPKEVSFPGPAGLNPEEAAAHVKEALNQVKVDIPINDAALAKSIDELNAFKEVIATQQASPSIRPTTPTIDDIVEYDPSVDKRRRGAR